MWNSKLSKIGISIIGPLLLLVGLAGPAAAQSPVQEGSSSANMLLNGNFEFGFYWVDELGFEPPDSGWVPNDWRWFKNEVHGKYNIYNNEGFGLLCSDDINQNVTGKNSLSLHMQSTDQRHAKLGVYTNLFGLTPGASYLFSISGTIQSQPGVHGNTVEVAFDFSDNGSWRKIPEEDWTVLPLKEFDLEFEISGPDDPDLAQIQAYYQVFQAKGERMTLFLVAHRDLPNHRTTIFTLDCVSVVPLSADNVNVHQIMPDLINLNTTVVDDVLEGVPTGVEVKLLPTAIPGEPESAPLILPSSSSGQTPDTIPTTGDIQSQEAAAPAKVVIVPPSGGVLDKEDNALLLIIAALIVVGGLVARGIWSLHRRG
jgi:hypothetical protein